MEVQQLDVVLQNSWTTLLYSSFQALTCCCIPEKPTLLCCITFFSTKNSFNMSFNSFNRCEGVCVYKRVPLVRQHFEYLMLANGLVLISVETLIHCAVTNQVSGRKSIPPGGELSVALTRHRLPAVQSLELEGFFSCFSPFLFHVICP